MNYYRHHTLYFLIFLLGCELVSGKVLETGIYHVSDKFFSTQVPVLEINDGVLGDQYLPLPATVTLESQNNANTDYKLDVHWNGTPRPSGLALVIGGKCLVFTYSSGGPEGSSDEFDDALHFSDPKLVKSIADYFKIKAFSRHHPGHEFTCEFIVKQSNYPLNGPVPVTLRINNCGKVPMFFSREGAADEEHDLFYPHPFTFTAYRHARDNFGGDVSVPVQPRKDPSPEVFIMPPRVTLDLGRIALMPGESFTKDVNLAEYLKLDKPGNYRVRGSFNFALFAYAQRKVLRVDPIDWRVLWYECAAGQFEFTIKDENGL